MRPSEAFNELESGKALFAGSVIRNLQQIPDVRSVTFTGSFVDTPGLASISDIDVVVVVGHLTRALFEACKAAVATVSPGELDLPDHRVVLNDTFGPLKFDQPGVIVVHLMIYDVAGHRDHVLQSPFTCLDWERSPFHAGFTLRSLYPVIQLQPRQFFAARRSLTNYLDDIDSGSISYRRHSFDGSARCEILERLPLDRRHQGEYAYHIVRNLVANYAKLVRQSNCRLSDAGLVDFWREHLPACAGLVGWFTVLREIKQARLSEFPPNTSHRTREFLAAFAHELEHTWKRRAIRHVFFRHAKSELNDGSFLGQRRDPPILGLGASLRIEADHVFVSPARRCRETVATIAPAAAARVDPRLHEIDYGMAEGLTVRELESKYPEISAAWMRGEDPTFPGGENTTAVASRLNSFLCDLPSKPSLVVTHNVVLRCLVGQGLGLAPAKWHHIPIGHLEQFVVLRLNGISYLDLSPEQVARISDSLAGHLS